MALLIPPGFAQLVLRWQLAGDPEPMVSTLGYDVSGLGGAYDAFLTSINNQYPISFGAGARLSVYTFIGSILYVGQDGSPPAVYERPAAEAGSSGSQAPPSNCATLVRKNTALGGRRGRGRMFLPPFNLAETSVDANGNLDGAYVSGTNSNLASWLVTGRSPVLLHNSEGVSPPPAPTPITTLVVQTKIATQRTRMRR